MRDPLPDSPATAGPPTGSVAPSVLPPLRVQGPHERGRFTTEAWGFLFSLYHSGAMPAAEVERIVERGLLHIEGRIGMAELRALTDDSGSETVPPDAGFALHH
jgi:hypothetical protein